MFVMYIPNFVSDTRMHNLFTRTGKKQMIDDPSTKKKTEKCPIRNSFIRLRFSAFAFTIHFSRFRFSGWSRETRSAVETLRFFIYDWWISALSSHCLYSLHSHTAPNTNMPEPIHQFVIFKIRQPLNLGTGTNTSTNKRTIFHFVCISSSAEVTSRP